MSSYAVGRRRTSRQGLPVALQKDSGSALLKQRQQLLHLADKFEPEIRAAMIKAINHATRETQLAKLSQAFASGNVEQIIEASGLDAFQAGLGMVQDELLQAFIGAGATVGTLIESGVGGLPFAVRFDAVNPAAAAAASLRSYRLVQNVTQDTRDALRAIITRQVQAGANPAMAARQIKMVVGLNEPQAVALANYQAALQANDPGKASSYAVGGNAKRVINARSNAAGLKQDRIDKLVEDYRARQIRLRASTIARTESMGAVADANAHAWQQAVDQSGATAAHMRRYWVSTNDDRTRPDHRALPELNAKGVAMDQPFVLPDGSTIMRPHDPAAPANETIRCRCTLSYQYEVPGLSLPPVLAGRSILPGGSK